MGNAITVRIDPDLSAWLAATAKRSGLSQGQIVRDQLEKARATASGRPFMRLAGSVRGPRDLQKLHLR